MSRVHIELPASFPFATEIPVRIADINYGGHLGNDAMLSLLHEARLRFLAQQGWSETNIAGCGLLMTDATVIYRQEVQYGDTLRIEVAVTDVQHTRFDVVYRVTSAATGQVAAEAKTGMVFFDYATRRIQKAPVRFVELCRLLTG